MRFGLAIFLMLLLLAACGGGDKERRSILPLSQAPKREAVQEIPPSGVITLKKGDTIYSVANRYQVTPHEIVLANELPPPYDLSGLRRIKIPHPKTHRVSEGDTLDSISRFYRVSKDEVIVLNSLIPPYNLRPGMWLTIPREIDHARAALPALTPPPKPPKKPEVASIKSPPAKPKAEPEAQPTPKVIEAPSETSSKTSSPQQRVVSNSSSSGSEFAWPVNGTIIEQFGSLAKGVRNDGVNIAAKQGALVRAASDGEVAFVGSGVKSFGNLVLIKHKDGWITAYAHLEEISVRESQRVRKGEPIGKVGQSGVVNSPQLHFELRKVREPVNPEEHISY